VKPKRSTLTLAIAFASYVLLGMPSGLLGVAWPSIRQSFGLPLDALGTLLTTVTVGYILSSFNSGRLISRFGVGPLLTVSSISIGAGVLGYMLAPAWWVMVAFGLLLGLGNGLVDAGLNVYVAEHYETRHMNWLHAFFGVGVTLGPMIMTAMLNAGQSWRWGYVFVVALEAVLVVSFIATRGQWQTSAGTAPVEADVLPPVQASSLDSLKMPLVWLGIFMFMLHTGVEFVAGQWSYTLFTEGRSIAPTVASLWTSVYWGSLTVSRLILGSVTDRIGVDRMLRLCILGIAAGSGLLWWNVTPWVSFLGLSVIGFGVALLFPSMISSTPRWMGAAHAANAIGFQVAAGSAGITILPGLAGILAERLGLEIIGPLLVATAIMLLLLFEVLVRQAAARAAEGAPS
jgi:fucose permease